MNETPESRTPEPRSAASRTLTLAEIQRRLGRIYLRRGKKEEAARAFREALRVEPNDALLQRRVEELERELAGLDAMPPARLMLVHESEETEEITIRSPLLRLGTHPGNDLILRDPAAHPHEARLVYRQGFFWLEPEAPETALRLQGRPLKQAERLDDGAIIRVGTSTLRLQVGTR